MGAPDPRHADHRTGYEREREEMEEEIGMLTYNLEDAVGELIFEPHGIPEEAFTSTAQHVADSSLPNLLRLYGDGRLDLNSALAGAVGAGFSNGLLLGLETPRGDEHR